MHQLSFILSKIRALSPEQQAKWRKPSRADFRLRQIKAMVLSQWLEEGAGIPS